MTSYEKIKALTEQYNRILILYKMGGLSKDEYKLKRNRLREKLREIRER